VDSAEFDTGDSHFPWTHLWVNGHLRFTFCTDLAHSCVPGNGTIGELVPSCTPASQQSQRVKRKQQRKNNRTITLKELCSRDSEPISDLSDSTGQKEKPASLLSGIHVRTDTHISTCVSQTHKQICTGGDVHKCNVWTHEAQPHTHKPSICQLCKHALSVTVLGFNWL